MKQRTIDALRRQRRSLEDAARQDWAAREAHSEKLAGLRAQIEAAQPTRPPATNAWQLRLGQGFQARLHGVLEQARSQEAQAQAHAQAGQQLYADCRRDLLAVERMQERLEARRREDRHRQEQHLLDDYSGYRHGR